MFLHLIPVLCESLAGGCVPPPPPPRGIWPGDESPPPPPGGIHGKQTTHEWRESNWCVWRLDGKDIVKTPMEELARMKVTKPSGFERKSGSEMVSIAS